MTVSARFDGRVFVPDGPVDLPVGRRVQVVPEAAPPPESAGAPSDVVNFCTTHDLAAPVAQLRQLAREMMTGLTDTDVWIQADPESGESWLVVEARLATASPTVLAEYNALVRRWIEMTEPRVRDLIRFTFTLP